MYRLAYRTTSAPTLVIRIANNRPRPSRLNDSDNPSDRAHGSSIRRPAPETALAISLPRSTVSRAGQAASSAARRGNRLTNQAARIATTNGERMKPITRLMLSWVGLESGYALVAVEFVRRSPNRSCTVHGVPVGVAAQRFAESSGRQRDGGERPGRCGLHEALPTLCEVSRYGAPRIDSAAGPVLINQANRQMVDAMFETSDGEPKPAERILT